jgi:hypothetical protein
MIKLTLPDMSDWTDEQSDAWYNSGNYGSFSTRNSSEAIDTFDDLLEPFGLQVGCYEGSSDHEISIVPLGGGPNKDAAVDAVNRQLADALSAVEAAEKREAAIMKKIALGLDQLNKRLKSTSQDDVMARALIMVQIDFTTNLQKDIRGY